MIWDNTNFTEDSIVHFGDLVVFNLPHKDLFYYVRSNYLFKENEIEIFKYLNVNPWKFCRNCIDYNPITQIDADGIWPEVKDEDYESLSKIIREIYKLISPTSIHKIELTNIDNYDLGNK